jgi:hypothetical protein
VSDAIDRLVRFHTRRDGDIRTPGGVCSACGAEWPCDSIAALTEAQAERDKTKADVKTVYDDLCRISDELHNEIDSLIKQRDDAVDREQKAVALAAVLTTPLREWIGTTRGDWAKLATFDKIAALYGTVYPIIFPDPALATPNDQSRA